MLVTGLEPVRSISPRDFKSLVSAYSTTPAKLVTRTGIEPVLPPWKGDVLTAWPRSQKTPRVGLEPTTTRLTAECSTIELSRIIKVCTFKTSYNSDLFFCNPHRKTHLDSTSLHLDVFASQIFVQLNPDLCRHICKIRISLYLFFSVINQIKPSPD